MPKPFDPMRDVRFRNKPLRALTHAETFTALLQALQLVKYLEDVPPPGVWPSIVPEDGPAEPLPYPPPAEFEFA